MAILVELNPSAAVTWSDGDGDVVWQGYGETYVRDVDDAGTLHLSMDGQAFDHYWDAEIISFSAPSYETATNHGGFVRMSFGSIAFSPDAFSSSWPPPKYAEVNVYWTATTEDAAIKIFEGNIYLESYDTTSVSYSFYAPTYAQELLDEVTDYNGDTVATPRAFGSVTHVNPTRLPDDGGSRPTYHLGGLGIGTNAKTVESFTRSSTKTKVTCTAAHGWSNGASITINGSVNFNGAWTIESVSGADFVIDTSFPTDNSETLPIRASAFTQGSFAVYDDGVPIQSNVITNGDGTFSLKDSPVGEVTISGTGADTTLTNIMDWGTTQLGINTYDDSGDRAPSPDVSHWATSQMPLIDFLSDVCAFFTHYFYIKADQLYLCDMLLDNGTDSLDEFEYFTASYSAADATKQVTATWTNREAYVGFLDDEVTTARYIKDYPQEVVVSNSDLPWGTEITVTPYHDTISNVDTAIDNILIVLNKNTASVDLPIGTNLPDPGKKITFTDTQMQADMSTYIWARRLQFDLVNDVVGVSGEGVIA